MAARPEHAAAWATLRHALWPEDGMAAHETGVARLLDVVHARGAAFVCIVDGVAVGFIEASRRDDYVNGCEHSPVVFVEGLYVRPEQRGTGIGRALTAAVEMWGRAIGCRELGSDADLANTPSHRFHAALGFVETERVVFFRKPLDG